MTPEAQAMIEKAARAIYSNKYGGDDGDGWDEAPFLKSEVLSDAHAALTAVIPGILAGTHAELPLAADVRGVIDTREQARLQPLGTDWMDRHMR